MTKKYGFSYVKINFDSHCQYPFFALLCINMVNDKKIIKLIKNHEIGVLPTDTLFGLVGSAFSKKAVEKIYQLKERNPKSPCIILISSIKDLEKFNIKLDKNSKIFLRKNWPGKISVALSCPDKKLQYLHRGTKFLAFRFPNKKELINLIKKTGPLVAPSANPENKKPASSITEAKKYFGDEADFYVPGKANAIHSTLVKIEKGEIIILREGAAKVR